MGEAKSDGTKSVKVVRVTKGGKKASAKFLPLVSERQGIVKVMQRVRDGFPSQVLQEFQDETGLTSMDISKLLSIPPSTLTRRQRQERLRPEESDRLLRAKKIFDLAVGLFEGDVNAARKWLQTPQYGLGGETPLDYASKEVGAREVENLIGRLEHGMA